MLWLDFQKCFRQSIYHITIMILLKMKKIHHCDVIYKVTSWLNLNDQRWSEFLFNAYFVMMVLIMGLLLTWISWLFQCNTTLPNTNIWPQLWSADTQSTALLLNVIVNESMLINMFKILQRETILIGTSVSHSRVSSKHVGSYKKAH